MSKRAILLIDHGSRRQAANELLRRMADLVRSVARNRVIVEHAHMELARPSIAEGVQACLAAGAHELIAMPYMLAPGRHASEDIPKMVSDALEGQRGIVLRMAPPFGLHSKLAEVVLERCEVMPEPARSNDA